jgi:hypothetical protein
MPLCRVTRNAAQDVVADHEHVHRHVELVVIHLVDSTTLLSAHALGDVDSVRARPRGLHREVAEIIGSGPRPRQLSSFMARSSLASASITRLSGSSRGIPSANSIGALFSSS